MYTSLSVVGVLLLCCVQMYSSAKNCCTPIQWESVNFIEDGRVTEGSKAPTFTKGIELVSVDGINHKIASVSNLNQGGFNVTVQIIQLFDQGVMYTVESGECKHSPLPAWSPRCVPDNATLVKSTYYGLGANKIDVDIYNYASGPNQLFITMAHTDCTPVATSGYGAQAGVSALSIKTYTNVTLGIKDTSVFIVPEICKNATGMSPRAPYADGHPYV